MTTQIHPRNTFDNLKASLSDFQKTLHLPADTRKGKDDPGNLVYTVFFCQYRKATWYFHFPEQMESAANDDTCFTFKAKPQPHGLLFSDLCQRLPTIVCQDGYEARWTHNVGSNVMIEGIFMHNDVPLQHIDYVYNDMHGQCMIPEDQRKARAINIGNLAYLQNWSDELAPHDASFTMPWFYSSDFSSYFPLYLCGFLDRIDHRLTLRRMVNDLLLVRRAGTNTHVSVDSKSIKSIDGKAPTGDALKLPMPTVWGEYLYLSDGECDYNRQCFAAAEKKDVQSHNILYIDDIIPCDEDNPVALGNTVMVKTESSGYPVHAFGWVAQNADAKEAKYYSNYSTNALDHASGWSPIAYSSLSLGSNGKVYEKLPSFRTERVHTPRHYPCMPEEPGYNFWALGAKAKDHNPKPGVVIKNGSLTVRLADMNPMIHLHRRRESPCGSNFYVRLRMTYTKRVVFSKFPPTEKDRDTGRSVVIIQGT